MFVEVEGYISNKGGDDNGIANIMRSVMPQYTAQKKPSSYEYVSCKRWIKVSQIEEIIYEAHDFVIDKVFIIKKPNIYQPPQQPVLVDFGDGNVLPRRPDDNLDGIANLLNRFHPPQLPSNAPRLRDDNGIEDNDDLEDEEKLIYAPYGWWILTRSGVTTTKYRCAKPEQIQTLIDKKSYDETAVAINRLADEIALKPSTQMGSLVLDAAERYHKFASDNDNSDE